MTVRDLRQRYGDALLHGPKRVKARLDEALYQSALGGNVTAMRMYFQRQKKGLL